MALCNVQDTAVSERPQWARSWPAMVVLAVSAIVWSKEVEDAIKGERTEVEDASNVGVRVQGPSVCDIMEGSPFLLSF
eukprot:1139524-Pelagomonas_calceolata.AAC.4